jgi:glycosyltransferase involved in cell wall biosynthesis
MTSSQPRIAIVSDPLVQRGGAERVVEMLASLFPEAPIYAILYSKRTGPASLAERVIPSFLQKVPFAVSHHRQFLPFFPAAVESFDLSQYDIIISSHHTAAKGILRSAEQQHICYCHTPMRALWERPHEELRSLPAARPVAAYAMSRLREWDVSCALRVDRFLANSEVTRRRIAKHYGREAAVVYPPCVLPQFEPNSGGVGTRYLVASRDVPYKRIDIAVEATRLARRELTIVGSASRRYDAAHVEQLGVVTDAELVRLMHHSRALLFPANEDFGMTPVEMMACGRPVIAYAKGGALETVIDGVTGLLVAEQTPEAFARAILEFERISLDPIAIRRNAERFSTSRFADAVYAEVLGAGRVASGNSSERDVVGTRSSFHQLEAATQ